VDSSILALFSFYLAALSAILVISDSNQRLTYATCAVTVAEFLEQSLLDFSMILFSSP